MLTYEKGQIVITIPAAPEEIFYYQRALVRMMGRVSRFDDAEFENDMMNVMGLLEAMSLNDDQIIKFFTPKDK